ncbi:MAG: hypothetical protein NTY98_06735 [Verrucomicrobia bacterium]|nr:hypothetical protein [Verrucomicrobiota bacterium]
MSRTEMLAQQERSWRALAHRAFATSPFYRRHLAGLDLDRCALSDIPVLTKTTLLEHWDEIVADPRLHWKALHEYLREPKNWGRLLHGRWMVSMTSGTTGASLAIPHEITSVDWNNAVHAIRQFPTASKSTTPLPSFFKKRPVVAAFICTSAPTVSASLLQTRPWIGSLLCDYRPVSITAPWNQIIDQLHEIKPTVLVGYASLIGRLAQARLDGTLRLDLPAEGGAIVTGGDNLTPGIRLLCRQAFGIDPLNGYGCGETLGIARQFPGMDHMTVFEDLAVFEAVDHNEQESPPETLSDHALVTPLLNTALPLLRYRIEDRVRFGPAPAGWPFKLIHEVSGRSDMTYIFHAPEKLVFVGVKLLIVMENQPLVSFYQFCQTGPCAMEGRFVLQPGTDPADVLPGLEAAIRQSLNEGGCSKVSCKAVLVHHLEPDPRTGKVEQNVPFK